MKKDFFSDDEKVAYFDEIANHYYNINFGQVSKSDMELMMFHFYVEKLMPMYTKDNEKADYIKCSDYNISKQLGITQQRVRNLKIKNRLAYPIEDYKWDKELADLMDYARYDSVSKKVTLNIPDPNLYIEIQNFIEEKHDYVEIQLNSKILQLRVEYFIELAIMLENKANRKDTIDKLKNNFKVSSKADNAFDEKRIGKFLFDLSLDTSTILENISGLFSPTNVIGRAIVSLLSKK